MFVGVQLSKVFKVRGINRRHKTEVLVQGIHPFQAVLMVPKLLFYNHSQKSSIYRVCVSSMVWDRKESIIISLPFKYLKDVEGDRIRAVSRFGCFIVSDFQRCLTLIALEVQTVVWGLLVLLDPWTIPVIMQLHSVPSITIHLLLSTASSISTNTVYTSWCYAPINTRGKCQDCNNCKWLVAQELHSICNCSTPVSQLLLIMSRLRLGFGDVS